MAELFDLSKNLIIDKETAALQTRTCHRLLALLKDSPGVILGDDVGMGKTYIAIAAAVSFLKRDPTRSILVITPSWLMNDKWFRDVNDFIDVNLNTSAISLLKSDVVQITGDCDSFVKEIREQSPKAKIMLIPIKVLASGRKCEKSFLITCWFRHRRFHAESRKRLLKAVGGDVTIFSPLAYRNMGITYNEIPDEWYTDLDNLDISALNEKTVYQLKEELKNLYYRALRAALPDCSLLILDEAHKMKNSNTVKRHSLEVCIQGKFSRGLFLTATPFQLYEGELRSIMGMFQKASIPCEMEVKYQQSIDYLFREMAVYIETIKRFEQYVRESLPTDNTVLERLLRGDRVPDTELNNDICETFETYQRAIVQKNSLELIMRTMIIRNVKQKDKYRKEIIGMVDGNSDNGIPLSEENYLIFAMLEKAIHEILAQGNRTFIASVKQSFTSSYSAAKASSINYRNVPSLSILHKMPLETINHPKIVSVVDEVVAALKNGEKTLVFCDRVETIKELQEDLEKGLNKAYHRDIEKLFDDDSEKSFETYRRRFSSAQDVSWFLLQENYIHSVLVPILKLLNLNESIFPKATDLVDDTQKLYAHYNKTVKANYRYLKRIVEQLVFQRVMKQIPNWQKKMPDSLYQTVKNIINPDYVEYGLNLQEDDDELNIDEIEDAYIRSISVSVINNIMTYQGLWAYFHNVLNKLPPLERDELVSNMILWLRRDKRFFIELRKMEQKYPDNNRTWQIEQTFKRRSKRGDILAWEEEFGRFLKTYSETKGEASKRELILGLGRNEIIDSITGSSSTERREKIIAGFNTPFYPLVIVAMPIMQEGIDLQRECKRLIHYDLEWNPASMEQRVGRIDRIGSLVAKLREQDNSTTLDIFYPYIRNTIDESIYLTVKEREKWFNLILGGTPDWDTFQIDKNVSSLPKVIFNDIQINLSVQ